MSTITLPTSGVEIDTDRVDEIKKMEGENDAYHIFMKPGKEGRMRYVGNQEDVDAISDATGKDHQKRRSSSAGKKRKH